MEWIDMIERFNTFGVYPFATLIHWAIGAYCGRELEIARIHRDVSAAPTGAVVFFGWIAYEITEYLTEHDSPDVDIANGLGGVLLGIVFCKFCLYYQNRLDPRIKAWIDKHYPEKRPEDDA